MRLVIDPQNTSTGVFRDLLSISDIFDAPPGAKEAYKDPEGWLIARNQIDTMSLIHRYHRMISAIAVPFKICSAVNYSYLRTPLIKQDYVAGILDEFNYANSTDFKVWVSYRDAIDFIIDAYSQKGFLRIPNIYPYATFITERIQINSYIQFKEPEINEFNKSPLLQKGDSANCSVTYLGHVVKAFEDLRQGLVHFVRIAEHLTHEIDFYRQISSIGIHPLYKTSTLSAGQRLMSLYRDSVTGQEYRLLTDTLDFPATYVYLIPVRYEGKLFT